MTDWCIVLSLMAVADVCPFHNTTTFNIFSKHVSRRAICTTSLCHKLAGWSD